MIKRNQAIWIHYRAWDTANNVFIAGDVGNHTLKVIKDGVINAATNTPQEISAGRYRILGTAPETNGLFISLAGVSSTPDVYIIPTHMITDDTTTGVEMTVQYTAWDMAANVPKTGDDGNHTMIVAQANAAAGADNSPSEVDDTDVPGLYSLVLADTETIGVLDSVFGTSNTADVVIMDTVFPVALAEDLPAETDVRLAVDYDNANLTGSAAIPSPNDTRLNIPVDATVGNLVLPSEDVTLINTGFGSLGTELTGNRTDAPENKVLENEKYGANGTSKTGTLEPFEASFELPQVVILEGPEVIIIKEGS